MDLQTIAVLVLFAAALAYVGRVVFRSIFRAEKGCASNCNKCSANFTHIPTPKK